MATVLEHRLVKGVHPMLYSLLLLHRIFRKTGTHFFVQRSKSNAGHGYNNHYILFQTVSEEHALLE